MGNRLFGYATASDHQIFIKGDKINHNWNQDFNKADGGEVLLISIQKQISPIHGIMKMVLLNCGNALA